MSAQSWPSSVKRCPLLHGYCHFLQVLEISWLNLDMPRLSSFGSWCNESKMEGISLMYIFFYLHYMLSNLEEKMEISYKTEELNLTKSFLLLLTKSSLQFLAPVHVLALQGVFASLSRHTSSLRKHIASALFLFHFSVNGKGAMAVFSLRWEDPNLMMLRNLGTWSMALGLFSLYVTAAFSSCRSQQIMSGFCTNRLKEGEDKILAWSLLVCFVTFSFLPKKQK